MLLIILYLLSFRYRSRSLLVFNFYNGYEVKNWSYHVLIQKHTLQYRIKYSWWSQALWIVFGSSCLGEGLQEDLYLGLFRCLFRSFI